ncbi:transposase [Streptomyces sp. NPDC087300]|uniref:transposase n=1 Tax=Streptomyces sp. NPDC087300 TaxID=3365780 RepID=UPI0038217DC3
MAAGCAYGRSVGFRLAFEDCGLDYVVAVEAKEVAHAASAQPYWPTYGGLGPPTLPRYRTRPLTLPELTAGHGVFSEASWRQGSKGTMRSRFTVLKIRPAGKQSLRHAQEHGGGHHVGDGVLPLWTLLVEQAEQATEPTGYWTPTCPPTLSASSAQSA